MTTNRLPSGPMPDAGKSRAKAGQESGRQRVVTLAPEARSLGAQEQRGLGRCAPIRLVREGPVPEASCPHCGGRLALSTVGLRWQVHRPSDVADRLLLQLGTLEREELHVLALNTRNVVLHQERVYQGNVSASVVRIGELFTEAVRRHARAVLLVHNHPSGDPTPSPEDLHLTAQAVAAGRLLDVPVLDHIVIGAGAFVSLRERGVPFEPTEPTAAREPRGAPHSARNRPVHRPPTATGGPRVRSVRDTVLEYRRDRDEPEAVGPDWRPCRCTHGRPVHLGRSGARPEHCRVASCACLAYDPAPAAPQALGAPAYSRAWEPVRPPRPAPTAGPKPVRRDAPSRSAVPPVPALQRRYLDHDVHAAAVERMMRLYAAGHRVVVSVSGGKDSTVCLEIARIAARMTGRLPVEAMHRDDEIMTPGTFEYLERIAQDPEVDLRHWYSGEPVGYWFSRSLPFYWPFDPDLPPERWMRRPPAHAEEVVEHLPWYVNPARYRHTPDKQLVSVLGLRAQESPWRLRGIHASGGYLTRRNRVGAIVARPIYDWTARDVWRFIAQSGCDYSRGYDVMLAAGVPRQRLRIASLGIAFASLYDHPRLARAFPGWAARLEGRLGPDLARVAELGVAGLQPNHRPGETWAQTLQRECVDEAPAWIAERTLDVLARARHEHALHAGMASLPDDAPCPRCTTFGSERVIARQLYWGAPWHSPWLPDVHPEQFRPDKLGRLVRPERPQFGQRSAP